MTFANVIAELERRRDNCRAFAPKLTYRVARETALQYAEDLDDILSLLRQVKEDKPHDT